MKKSNNDKFRKIIATIQQQAFKDLSRVATLIFSLYVKIGNIFFVITQQLVNILNIFKSTVNTTAAIAKLLLAFINLIRLPFNFIYGVVEIISGILKPLIFISKSYFVIVAEIELSFITSKVNCKLIFENVLDKILIFVSLYLKL